MNEYMAELRSDGMIPLLEFALARNIPNWASADFSRPCLHLGPGRKFIPDTVELEWPKWDGEAEDSLAEFADDSVGGIFATHFLEHLSDPRHIIAEAARTLAPGCPFTIFVPHARYGEMHLQDLDHKTPFVLSTWKNHLSNSFYGKGRSALRLDIGVNIAFGVKDENIGILTQLIKRGE